MTLPPHLEELPTNEGEYLEQSNEYRKQYQVMETTKNNQIFELEQKVTSLENQVENLQKLVDNDDRVGVPFEELDRQTLALYSARRFVKSSGLKANAFASRIDGVLSDSDSIDELDSTILSKISHDLNIHCSEARKESKYVFKSYHDPNHNCARLRKKFKHIYDTRIKYEPY